MKSATLSDPTETNVDVEAIVIKPVCAALYVTTTGKILKELP
jgi:hypothetical protein